MLKSIRSHIVNNFGSHRLDSFLLDLAGEEGNRVVGQRWSLSVVQVCIARSKGLELWALCRQRRAAKVLRLVRAA